MRLMIALIEKLRKGNMVPHARARRQAVPCRGERVVSRQGDLTVVWLKTIECHWLQFKDVFSLAYILHSRIPFPYTHNTSVLSSPCRVALLHPRPEPLRAQRSGEQASKTRRFASRHLLGCAGNQVFEERLPRLRTWDRRDRLLPGGDEIDYSLGFADRLFRGGRSQDCTANIFLHWLWSATSSNALCRLVRMKPSVPSAVVPPLGIILNDYILFSVCL